MRASSFLFLCFSFLFSPCGPGWTLVMNNGFNDLRFNNSPGAGWAACCDLSTPQMCFILAWLIKRNDPKSGTILLTLSYQSTTAWKLRLETPEGGPKIIGISDLGTSLLRLGGRASRLLVVALSTLASERFRGNNPRSAQLRVFFFGQFVRSRFLQPIVENFPGLAQKRRIIFWFFWIGGRIRFRWSACAFFLLCFVPAAGCNLPNLKKSVQPLFPFSSLNSFGVLLFRMRYPLFVSWRLVSDWNRSLRSWNAPVPGLLLPLPLSLFICLSVSISSPPLLLFLSRGILHGCCCSCSSQLTVVVVVVVSFLRRM